jgi:hypothetical protein
MPGLLNSPPVKTPDGRPILKNTDGSFYTERTVTVEMEPGVWVNIPTVYGGKQVSEDEAIRIIRSNRFVDPDTKKLLDTFGSVEKAVAAAEARSKMLGTLLPGLLNPRPPGLPFSGLLQ